MVPSPPLVKDGVVHLFQHAEQLFEGAMWDGATIAI